jgi:hypothetical protein
MLLGHTVKLACRFEYFMSLADIESVPLARSMPIQADAVKLRNDLETL